MIHQVFLYTFILLNYLYINCFFLLYNKAPGSYEPEKTNPDQKQGFSFGMRTEIQKSNDSPSPNAYNVVLNNPTTSHSFGIKPKIHKSFNTPGNLNYIVH